jgi:glyoxylase-like metal-dependent hydrolase (beta-lactamase superfamily II)
VPDARVVFAADVMFVGVLPVMWAGPTANWLAALDRILALEPERVVPGHGPVCGPPEVRALREHLAWVDAAAGELLAAGRSPFEAARELIARGRAEGADWAGWDQPERLVITVRTIDRHRRGAAGPVGARERARIFGEVAELAAEAGRA